jgi:adenylate kinase family enzyme
MNNDQPLSVILFGLQGSGKGTQAQLLKEYLDSNTSRETLYLETGQLLRDFIEEDNYTSKLVDTTISNGELLPSFMPTFVLGRKMVHTFTGQENVIFDGATRRVNQTVMLDSMLRFYKLTPYHVIRIELSEESAVKRLLLRGRSDDTREKIQKRIAWSKEHMDAVTKQFDSFNCHIHKINGEPAIEAVHENILAALELK